MLSKLSNISLGCVKTTKPIQKHPKLKQKTPNRQKYPQNQQSAQQNQKTKPTNQNHPNNQKAHSKFIRVCEPEHGLSLWLLHYDLHNVL